MENKNSPNLKRDRSWAAYIAVVLAAIITIAISWVLYQYTVSLLNENLRNRLIDIAKTAASQFDYRDLEELKVEDDWLKPEWEKVVTQLDRIRIYNEDIVFAYIVRKRESDPSIIEFVSDADCIDPYAEIDLNNDGLIDEADALIAPGFIYEDASPEIFNAFDYPTAEKELYEDQWGQVLSAYAPIYDDEGVAVAVIGLDIRAGDFYSITRETFTPFMLFVLVLLLILLVLATSLIHIWKNQVHLLADLDKQKDELLSMVTHQLATPVSSVKWYLEMILDGDLGEVSKEQKEYLQSMAAITDNLSDLVSMILDVSRIQLNKVSIVREELDIKGLIDEVLQITSPKAAEKKINFESIVPNSMPTVHLDKRYTHMIIQNLLSNAIKYTPEGGTVRFEVDIKDGYFTCNVSDTGCGIPKKDQEKIFGKLFRASNVRNEIDGNGFGLYIVKGAVDAQGGSIWFQSIEGEGTTFAFKLPIK